jgi:hypothetical protein
MHEGAGEDIETFIHLLFDDLMMTEFSRKIIKFSLKNNKGYNISYIRARC